MKNLGKNMPNDPAVLIDGINLNKKEYETVGKIFNKMAKKYGQRYSSKQEIIDTFKSEMRQQFNAKIDFEDVSLREEAKEAPFQLIACRFKKERPLIFLVIDMSSNSWGIVDEKRFPPLDEKSPFLPVSI